jgi:membrane-associated phospholipid phosphatase
MAIIYTAIFNIIAMFQTEPILYLQSFASDSLTFIMMAITQMGYEQFIIGIICFIIFGISFRKGFLLLQLMMWQGLINGFLKELFGMPRPVHVDSNVQYLDKGEPNTSPFISGGAKGFFEPLNQQVVEAIRLQIQNGMDSYGFPSGHVQNMVSLWGGIAILFKKHILYWIVPVMVVLMALSRMYLGRHFIADVIGSAVIGGIILLGFNFLLVKYSLMESFFNRNNFVIAARIQNIIFLFFLLLLPLILAITRMGEASINGYLLGTNIAFLVLLFRGIPDDSGNLSKRAARVIVGFTFYLLVMIVVYSGFDRAGFYFCGTEMEYIAEFIESFIIALFGFWGSVTFLIKLGLFSRENEPQMN